MNQVKNKFSANKLFATIGIAVALALVLLLSMPYLLKSINNEENATEENQSSKNTTTEKQIIHHANSPVQKPAQIWVTRMDSSSKIVGRIGSESLERQSISVKEKCLLEVLLPARSYMVVFAITPGKGGDKISCIWPLNLTTKPLYCDGLLFGSKNSDQLAIKTYTVDHYLAIRQEFLQFSNGPGLYGILVVRSQKTLPRFDEVVESLRAVDWPLEDASSGAWAIRNDLAIALESATTGRNNPDSEESSSQQTIVNQIKQVYSNAIVDGLVFRVESD